MKPKIGKNIRLPLTDHDKRINGKKYYLAKLDGLWYIGKFHKEWYGWNFDGGPYGAGCQVDYDEWQALYEWITK